jgi:GNAT superfamily N-acetyltransferase
MSLEARFGQGVERFGPADRDELVRFQKRWFGAESRQADPKHFAWLFEGNPCRSPEGLELWVCRRHGDIVGQQAGIPFDLQVRGRAIRGSWGIDLMVDEGWRLRGVGPALMQTHVDSNPLVAGVNMSDAAYRVYRRWRWIEVGVLPTYVRPIDARRSQRVSPAGIRGMRTAGVVAAPALGAASLFSETAAAVFGAKLVSIGEFDERVDRVWRSASGTYRVIARRDAPIVRWWFDENPRAAAFQRFYLMRREEVLGYVVLRRDSWKSEPVMVVLDYLVPPRWAIPLFALAIAHARAEGVIALVCRTLNPPLDRMLRGMGFVRLGAASVGPVRLMVDPVRDDGSLRAVLSDPKSWFLTSGDSDLAHANLTRS